MGNVDMFEEDMIWPNISAGTNLITIPDLCAMLKSQNIDQYSHLV